MKILSIDIGGTYSRFGHFSFSKTCVKKIGEIFKLSTQSKNIKSFKTLIDKFTISKPNNFSQIGHYDLIVIAAAGPIIGNKCKLTNIKWNIDLSNFEYVDHTCLVNDFVAQSYGLLNLNIEEQLVGLIENENQSNNGNIGVIGAGSGLGHCCMVPVNNVNRQEYVHIPSEAGRATFSFIGNTEKALEEFLLKKEKLDYCCNENIISGSGLSLIYEFLTGNSIDPKMINNNDEFNETLKLFAKLYGRVCRNYCLYNYITNSLIITGGIVKYIPAVVTYEAFYKEFINSESHKDILKNLNIYFNPGIEMGLYGCAYYGINNLQG